MHLQYYSTKVILGDFNADQLQPTSGDGALVQSICADNNLQLVPHGATHHTFSSDTWLDLCFIDGEDVLLSHWKTDVPFIDGHDLIMATDM